MRGALCEIKEILAVLIAKEDHVISSVTKEGESEGSNGNGGPRNGAIHNPFREARFSKIHWRGSN